MRRNNPLVLVIIGLMICSSLVLQAGNGRAQAADSNLADKAVLYLYNQFVAKGAQFDGSVNGAYVAYILSSAGVDVNRWIYNGKTLPNAVADMVYADILKNNTQIPNWDNTSLVYAVSAKKLAQDLVEMQVLGRTDYANQLKSIVQSRDSGNGFDNSPYSDIPAYELLGRAGLLSSNSSVANIVYAKNYILGQQGTDGSWGYSDFPTTTEAVRALAYLDPGKSDPQIQQAITNGCNWMRQQQQADGSFTASSWDDPLIDTTEAIATQKVLNLDPASWKNASGKSAVDYLTANALNSDGSFGSTRNVMDATWALDGFNQLEIHAQGQLAVTPSPKTLTVGDPAFQLTATFNGVQDVTQDAAWSVADSSIASVDHGQVTALAVGSTVVTAVYNSFSATAALTVRASGGSSGSTCTPGVAVVGKSGELLFRPATVTILSTNKWGSTALGALDATGLHYTNGAQNLVTSISGQSNSGVQGWMYTVNDIVPNVGADQTEVASGDHVIWYYSLDINSKPPTWSSLQSGSPASSGVTSTTGNSTINPAAGGTVGLGSEVSVNIPAGALNGTRAVDVAVRKVDAPPTAPTGFRVLGSVFEFTVGGSTNYKFNKPVTLTFSFDPAALSPGETPAVYYYDSASSQWVSLGGAVSGSTITVNVDHFTKFAVMAGKAETPIVPAIALPIAPGFSDVSVSYWAYQAIGSLYSLGYVSGYPDGTFRPDSHITRAEFISILNSVLKPSAYNPATPDFSDVDPGDWFYDSVKDAVYAGIVKGYGDTFGPNNQITREELAVILFNALGGQDEAGLDLNERTGFTDDAGISSWARGCVAAVVKDGLIKGYPDDNSFRPKNSATRAEACTVINNFLSIYK